MGMFALDPALVAGMVLVGSINGGQASNLCTFIANGNVALSVLMTTATTIGAIFMTPLLCKTFLGTVVPVDAAGIVVSTLQVVLAPILVGMTMNAKFPKVVKKITPVTPVIGMVSTCLLVAAAVGQVAEPIMNAGLTLQLPVMLLHLVGGVVGYWGARALGFGETSSRTMAIETSMKSSAFGFLLAKLLVAGMVLVGSINGGQASNLCTFIANGNVALSVLMTTATTIGAIFMTPLLCKTFLGTVVPVDAAGIVVSTLQVVLAPILVGMTMNAKFPKVVKKITPVTPVIGMVSTCLLVAAA